MQNIVAIIVTFNRRQLLPECLTAVEQQVFKPAVVYVVDNASTDGTDKWIHENGYDALKSGIEFRYIRLAENSGGSGGFYLGIKTAYEAPDNFDAFWVMDDDGVPNFNQLHHLLQYLPKYDYLSPLVVAKENTGIISFDKNQSVQEYIQKASDGLIFGVAFPFNGILYSRRLVEKVGFPIKDMFIWGDEVNYHQRCINADFNPVVVIDAIHIHPADRQPRKEIFGSRGIIVPAEDWKLYCYARNRMYNLRTTATTRHLLGDMGRMLFRYTIYFTFYSFDWRRLGIVYRAMWDGFRKDLSRLDNYR